MDTKPKSDQVSRRAPSLTEMGMKLRAAVKANMPALRTSIVAREVKAKEVQ